MEAQPEPESLDEMFDRNDRLAHAIMHKIADLAIKGVQLENEQPI